jgi:hypothetical protein
VTAELSADAPVPADGALPVPILRTEDLTVRFGGLTALNQVNFELAREEICVVIGPERPARARFQPSDRRCAYPPAASCLMAARSP